MAVTPTNTDRSSRVAVDWFYIRTRTIVLLAVLVLAAVGFGAWWLFAGRQVPIESRAVAELQRAEAAVSEARAMAPDAENIALAEEHIAGAHAALDAQLYTRTIDESQAAQALARELIEGLGRQAIGVRVARVDGDVRIKRSGQFMWEPASERSILAMGDQIRTGSNGGAQLVFFDGTMMTVEPGTLLEIRELFQSSDDEVQRVSERLAWGSLKASTNETEGKSTVHEVSTESAAVRTDRASEFTVQHDRERGQSEVTALRGELTLESRGKRVTVSENTRVALDRQGIREQLRILDPPLLDAPPDQKTFLAPQQNRIDLAWLPLEQADFYQVQVSDRPMFSRLEYDLNSVVNEHARLPGFAPGVYYWRVCGVDEKGHRGRWSDTRRFRVLGAKFQDPDDTDPPQLEVSEILVVGTNAIISGRSEPGALVWIAGERVDVDENGSFTWVIKLHRDGENKIAFQAQDAAGNETNRVGYAYVDVF